MNNRLLGSTVAMVVLVSGLWGCTQNSVSDTSQTSADTSGDNAAATGTLEVRVNGEDFVRQGFVTKDDWQIQFDHVYVHLAEVTAYQTDPPFQPNSDTPWQETAAVEITSSQTVDLAEGAEDAEPILLTTTEAQSGQYNAIAWQMPPATTGPASEYVLVMSGTAQKDDTTFNFRLQFDQPLAYRCGEYVGDDTKGILEADGQADLEITFHFDHLFGDGEASPDDEINTGALGFTPLVALAEGTEINADQETLQIQLSEADYQLLTEAYEGLAHVGEGHCEALNVEAQ